MKDDANSIHRKLGITELRRVIDETPAEPASPRPPSKGNGADNEIRLVSGSEIEPEPVEWTWPNWLQSGAFNLLAGQSATGKSTIAMSFAAIVSRLGLVVFGSSKIATSMPPTKDKAQTSATRV